MSKINFENFDKKLFDITNKENWKELQKSFNEKKIILIFGHGGNLAVADHSAIDICRLTDKIALAPGSAIQCTSLISDFSFESWIKEWIKIVIRGYDKTDILVIGLSCSVNTKSNETILNALEYCCDNKISTSIITARYKHDLNKDINQIVNESIYYHTSEVLTLALFYQLIHGYNNSDFTRDLVDCPPAIKCSQCDFGDLDHSFCEYQETPPGKESEMNNIAIDFDGVVHNFDKGFYDGTCYGEPIEGVQNAFKELSKKYNIIIFSSKCLPDRPIIKGLTGKELIIEWLKKYDLLKYVKDITYEKIRAKYYIDDKAIRFENWDKILKTL